MDKRTYSYRTVSRGSPDGELGLVDYTTTDVVHATGRVESHTVGMCEGERVNESKVTEWGPLDLDKVHAARISQGWREVVK